MLEHLFEKFVICEMAFDFDNKFYFTKINYYYYTPINNSSASYRIVDKSFIMTHVYLLVVIYPTKC